MTTTSTAGEREREGSNKRENSGLKRVKQLSVAVACGFLDLRLETQRVFGINAYNYYFFFAVCVCLFSELHASTDRQQL